MSIIAKTTYLAEKIRLIKEKIDPIIEWYNNMKQMGLDKLAMLAQEIQEILSLIHEYDQQIDGLLDLDPLSFDPTVTSQVKDLLGKPYNKLGFKSQDSLLSAARKLDRLNRKLHELKLRLIKYRTYAIEDIEVMIESSLKGISGINVDIQITLPDPITGEGGSIVPIITPKLFDEATALVDQTLTDPTTIVTSVVSTSVSTTGTASAQTGIGTGSATSTGIVVT